MLLESIKGSAKQAIISSRVLRAARRFARPRMIILRYHSVQPSGEYDSRIPESIVHPSDVFRKQMDYVARHFDPISLDQLAAGLADPASLPEKPLVITFDDGYVDNHEVALPILQEFGLTATFYVMGDSIGTDNTPWYSRTLQAFTNTSRLIWNDSETGTTHGLETADQRNNARRAANRRCASRTGQKLRDTLLRIEQELEVESMPRSPGLMMSWDQLRNLCQQGYTVGSHTLSHPNLALLTESELQQELESSKQLLESSLGTGVEHFSYPNPMIQPHWTADTCEAVRCAGYRTAVTSSNGTVSAADDPWSLRRLYVPLDLQHFRWTLEASLVGLSS